MILFLAVFRILRENKLLELPPGIFGSLASLEGLYVLLLIVETSFVSFLLEPDIFFFPRPGP